MSSTCRDDDVGPDDAVSTQHPYAEIGDVHRPTFATTATADPPEQFTHHGFSIRTFNQGVVAPGRGQQDIVGSHFSNDGDSAGFLTDRRMYGHGQSSLSASTAIRSKLESGNLRDVRG